MFSASSFINSLCVHVVFESSTVWGWHNLSGTSSDGSGGSLEEVTWVTQRQEKLFFNYLQLFIVIQWCNNYKFIIYIYREKLSLFAVFERQRQRPRETETETETERDRETETETERDRETETNEASGRCSLSMLLNLSESEDIAGEAFVLGETFFLVLLSSVWISDLLYWAFIYEHSWLTNQSQIISYSSTTF